MIDDLQQQIAQLLAQAQTAFDEAAAAFEDGDLGLYQQKNEEAAGYVEEALALADQAGIAPEAEPTPTEEESPAAE